jgi:outer membrane protein assembly factor BamC
VKSFPAVLNPGIVSLAVLAMLTGCGALENTFGGDKVDYRTANTKTQPLEVPPDLTQLARDSRYQPQGGVISASTAAQAPSSSVATASGAVAPGTAGSVRMERVGQQRWLVTPQSPEQIWPALKGFFEQRGFTLAVDNPQAGLLETNWAENRAKLPNDLIRTSIGRVLGGLFDTGERDLYRVRVERVVTATGTSSEIYLAHRGAEEIYTNERKESTAWRGRGNDPQLEADMLAKLMVALGTKEDIARNALAAATPASGSEKSGSEKTVKAPADEVVPSATSLVVNDSFDRAWRRVGLALDRGGFTVEDRDRASGLYYVRYVDPKSAGKDEPSWFNKLFSDSTSGAAVRYRVVVKGSGEKTNVSVQDAKGAADGSENARRIVALLGQELR